MLSLTSKELLSRRDPENADIIDKIAGDANHPPLEPDIVVSLKFYNFLMTLICNILMWYNLSHLEFQYAQL